MQLSLTNSPVFFVWSINLTSLFHIHFHSRYGGNSKPEEREEAKKKGFTIEKIKSLHRMIFNSISKWEKAYQFNKHWKGYYENDIESPEYLDAKEGTIRKWLEMIKPKSVIDLGANTGKFSLLAAQYAERVIALEGDYECVDSIENNRNNIFTLVGDLAKPSPALGILNCETESIYKRGNSEMVLGLALIHHLHFTNKISFAQISEIVNQFSNSYAILEFINNDDKKFQLLIGDMNTISVNYNENSFLKSMNKYFTLVDSKKLANSCRVLYLLKKD